MPCRSDYLEPNAREKESAEIMKIISWLFPKLGKKTPLFVHQNVNSRYGLPGECDNLTKLLCSTIREMTEDQLDKFVYNGRDRDARELADWWDNHKEVDRKREQREAREVELEILGKTTRDKLSADEFHALLDQYKKGKIRE